MALMGTAVPRVEDGRVLRGQARFVADLDLPGALHVRFVVSTVAHAELRSVVVDEARVAPGVVDVVTAADLDIGPVPAINPAFPAAMARPLLAGDRVRHVGQPI